MSAARTPRSAALRRSMVTRSSGLRWAVAVSTSTRPGTARIFAMMPAAISSSFWEPGPRMA